MAPHLYNFVLWVQSDMNLNVLLLEVYESLILSFCYLWMLFCWGLPQSQRQYILKPTVLSHVNKLVEVRAVQQWNIHPVTVQQLLHDLKQGSQHFVLLPICSLVPRCVCVCVYLWWLWGGRRFVCLHSLCLFHCLSSTLLLSSVQWLACKVMHAAHLQ